MALRQYSLSAVLGCLVLLLASGCSRQDLMQRFAPAKDQATAKQYMEDLREGQFGKIEADADPSIRGPSLPKTLAYMSSLIPNGTPNSIKLVGAQTLDSQGSITGNLTYEYGFRGAWILFNVATRQTTGRSTIVGMHVYHLTQSLEEQNRFSLSGKSPLQYAVLILAVLMLLFTFYALGVCIRTKLPKRKWVWILFILAGIGKFSVNWTTGAWTVLPVAFQVFSASAVRPLYGPWTLAVSIPLGAIVFLFLRKPKTHETDTN